MASIGQKKKGRPKLTWMVEFQGVMVQKGLTEEDQDNWLLKIL